eukprot:TRINITY_DN14557_c0_g2_i1.p1 TRINITY_DN14557_c0_g2~~TRINITY_DN14557_c0_g2_i1.p1  ORF type:complete len:284 (-),score=88.86 TRINITY_DN14557_c0_g2_i1:26-877(-)
MDAELQGAIDEKEKHRQLWEPIEASFRDSEHELAGLKDLYHRTEHENDQLKTQAATNELEAVRHQAEAEDLRNLVVQSHQKLQGACAEQSWEQSQSALKIEAQSAQMEQLQLEIEREQMEHKRSLRAHAKVLQEAMTNLNEPANASAPGTEATLEELQRLCEVHSERALQVVCTTQKKLNEASATESKLGELTEERELVAEEIRLLGEENMRIWVELSEHATEKEELAAQLHRCTEECKELNLEISAVRAGSKNVRAQLEMLKAQKLKLEQSFEQEGARGVGL